MTKRGAPMQLIFNAKDRDQPKKIAEALNRQGGGMKPNTAMPGARGRSVAPTFGRFNTVHQTPEKKYEKDQYGSLDSPPVEETKAAN